MPTSALEDWRYSRIDALDLERYAPAVDGPGSAGAEPFADGLLAAVGGGALVVETTDGWVTGQRGADPGIRVDRLAAGREEGEAAPLGAPDAFSLLNQAFSPDPLRITAVPGGTPKPVIVVHRVTRMDSAVFPRVSISAGADSEVSVLEIVTGEAAALVVPLTEIAVGRAARASYLQVQALGSSSWQIGRQVSEVQADATLTSAAVALGGDYARLRTESALAGAGASSRLLAMYFGAGTQMHDFRTVQHHRAPKTHSDLLYKGVVANRARSVYSGLIRVEKGARGTNAFQTNRNLVLHEGAHADSVPNLEIEDNDVRCSHASAVGPVAEDQRFYLESRGVPPQVAERLISLGFLGEVIERLPLAALGAPIGAAVAQKLELAEALESGSGGAA